MKNTFPIILFLFTSLVSSQAAPSSSEWQEDLRFLQKTVDGKYSFLFKKITKETFNDTVEAFYEEIPEMEQHEIVVGFSRLIASFKYGHTRMSFSDAPVSFHSIPIEFYQFKDGLYIKSAHKTHQDILGAKVLALEGVAIEEVKKAVYPTVPVENAMFFYAYGLDHMTIPEVLHAQRVIPTLKLDITLTLEKEGKRFGKNVACHQRPMAADEIW